MNDLLAEVDAILSASAARDPTTQLIESKLLRLWYLRQEQRLSWRRSYEYDSTELRQLERELFGRGGLLRAKHK